MAMKTRQVVGIVLGVAGAVISVGHLALMIVFEEREPYHGLQTWVPLGLILAVVGILLLRKKEPQ